METFMQSLWQHKVRMWNLPGANQFLKRCCSHRYLDQQADCFLLAFPVTPPYYPHNKVVLRLQSYHQSSCQDNIFTGPVFSFLLAFRTFGVSKTIYRAWASRQGAGPSQLPREFFFPEILSCLSRFLTIFISFGFFAFLRQLEDSSIRLTDI